MKRLNVLFQHNTLVQILRPKNLRIKLILIKRINMFFIRTDLRNSVYIQIVGSRVLNSG